MKLLLTLDFPPERGGIQHYLGGIVRHAYGPKDAVLVGCGSRERRARDRCCATVRRCTFPLAGINKKITLIPLLVAYIARVYRHETMRVECGNVYTAIIPWLVSRVKPQPYNVYVYGTEIVQLSERSFKNSLLKRTLQKAAHIYAITEYTSNCLRDIGVSTPVSLVPPRIELPQFQPKKNTGQKDQTDILTVGRLVQHKGHETLVRAMAKLRASHNVRLTIIGNGPEEKPLRALINELDLREYVRILSGVSDKQKNLEYERANLFILPSLEMRKGTEGFGIVLLEAMAHDIPIVASSVGGIVEVLNNGTCGELVEPGNPHALLEGIEHVLSENDYRSSLVIKARKRLLENYVW